MSYLRDLNNKRDLGSHQIWGAVKDLVMYGICPQETKNNNLDVNFTDN